jgi:hypothetical protein
MYDGRYEKECLWASSALRLATKKKKKGGRRKPEGRREDKISTTCCCWQSEDELYAYTYNWDAEGWSSSVSPVQPNKTDAYFKRFKTKMKSIPVLMVVVLLMLVTVDQSKSQGIFGNFFNNFFSNLNNTQRSRSSTSTSINRATTVSISSSKPVIQTTTEIVELVSTTTEFSFVTETVFQDVVRHCQLIFLNPSLLNLHNIIIFKLNWWQVKTVTAESVPLIPVTFTEFLSVTVSQPASTITETLPPITFTQVFIFLI